MNKKYFLKTLGCQMNILDSTYIQILLNRVGSQTQDIRQADIIILNTCSVKETSENKLLNILNFVSDSKYKLKDFSDTLKKILQSKTHLFPIDGKYLMQNGMKEGSTLGKVLKIIEDEWIINGFKISKDRVGEIIKSNLN